MSEWSSIQRTFTKLGGVIDNLEPQTGSRGRGLFAVNINNSSKVFCPKHLLLETNDITFESEAGLKIKQTANYSDEVIDFLEVYYNQWCWLEGGRTEAKRYHDALVKMPIQYRGKLIDLGVLSPALISPSANEKSLFQRYIFTRTASFEGKQVLVPLWDLINHSAFAQPFRNTIHGIESPPRGEEQEHLQKYSNLKSPLGMWAHYGFSCRSTVAYSFPNTFITSTGDYQINCLGHQKFNPDELDEVSSCGKIITIRCLPIGSISKRLPASLLRLKLEAIGIRNQSIYELQRQLKDWNIETRENLIRELNDYLQSETCDLQIALDQEIQLIENCRLT